MILTAAADVLAWILLITGGAFVLTGGIGVLRMPDFYSRMHPAGLTDTMGPILILTGAMLQAGLTLATLKLATILIFLLLTSPTATYALANAARLGGVAPRSRAGNRADA